jgi:hypothetical protein
VDRRISHDLAAGLQLATPFASLIFATRSLLRIRGATVVPAEVDGSTPREEIRHAEFFDRAILLGLRACMKEYAAGTPAPVPELFPQSAAVPGDFTGAPNQFFVLVREYLAASRGAEYLGGLAAEIGVASIGPLVARADDFEYWRDSLVACLRGDVRKLERMLPAQIDQGPFDPTERGPLKRLWPDEVPTWYRAADPPAIERGLRHARRVREAVERREAPGADHDFASLAGPRVVDRHPAIDDFDRLEAEVAELRRAIVDKFQARLDAVHELRNLGDYERNKALAKRVSVFAKEHGIALTFEGRAVYLRGTKGGAGMVGAFHLIAADERNKTVYYDQDFPRLIAVPKGDSELPSFVTS